MPPGQRSQYGGNPYWINQPTAPSSKKVAAPPRIYESDIIRNALGSGSPALISPANPAFTYGSRAYANAHGSQAGLNIPNSTNATTPGSGLSGAASSRLSGGGGGGGAAAVVDPLAGYTPDVADLSKNPIPGMYDTLLAYVKENADARPGIFQGYADKFKVNHDAANKQLYDAYLGSRTEQDANATAFGVDPAIVAQARDLAMRRSQENSDQSLADNQAWLLKAGLLSQQEAQARGTQFAGDKATKSAEWAQLEEERVSQLNLLKLQAIVDQINAKAKGGGGGGGRRGGGGSKGSSTDTGVTETNTLPYGGADAAAIAELIAQGDYEGAAAMSATVNRTMGNPAVKANQNAIDTNTAASIINGKKVPIPSIYFKNPNEKWLAPTYKAAQTAAKNVKTQTKIMPYLQKIGGLGTQPYTKIVTTDKGRAPH